MPKEFNFIYNKLVSDKNDIVGQIAYSIYKSDKLNFVKSKEDQNIVVTDDILKSFHDISKMDSSIESYKLKAEIIMQSFMDNALQEVTTEIEAG